MENNLTDNLKQLRQQYHLKQSDLATHLHVSRQTVSSWETGRNQPDIDTLLRLASFYHIPLAQLVDQETIHPSVSSQIPRGIPSILLAILFIERLTQNSNTAFFLWLDSLLIFLFLLNGAIYFNNKQEVNFKLSLHLYYWVLGLFVSAVWFSALTNLFQMGFAFQFTFFVSGLIAFWALIFHKDKSTHLLVSTQKKL
ncbi:helix-turn-helix transcriptional regulator [Agrilactobacillus fermenti]|uniref:helix-turn-helix transcriptional regulator n=1 Tax=Agrilactobacillus fermenti TaxID=2586909 RepID=UPI001E460177|nr:helix-turn-helix transcriptional regulator [Agrilactobacillus fermenti]MCD2256391.1 helix-turn-helix transcriptional regulator [Agrilactobacillus fermenti]